MRKLLWLLPVVLLSAGEVRADEGFWLPTLLGPKVYADMVKKGLKLTQEQIYNINKASLKDAVVLFRDGGTGAVVSSDGLVLTSYGAAAETGRPLNDGFYARSRQDEVSCPFLYVRFLVRIEDVTKDVESQVQGLSGAARRVKLDTIFASVAAKYADPSSSMEAAVHPEFGGNQFLVFVYQRYPDVRLVAAPPASLGRFGGPASVNRWPSHAAAFALFRVYAGADGKPAAYSAGNSPIHAKYVIPISLKGVKEGDFTMVLGYPRLTSRFGTSQAVQMEATLDDPSRSFLDGVLMDAVATGHGSALLVNGYARDRDATDAEMIKLTREDAYGDKVQEEARFSAWATGKPDYSGLLSQYAGVYAAWEPYEKGRIYLNRGIRQSMLMSFCASLMPLEFDLVNGKESAATIALAEADARRTAFLKAEDVHTDLQILAATVAQFYKDIPRDQQPAGFYEGIRSQYGDLGNPKTFETFSAALFSNTFFMDDRKWKAFLANPDATVLQGDPAYSTATAFIRNFQGKYEASYRMFLDKLYDLDRQRLKGVMDQYSEQGVYPDADSTLRVAFGNVKGYAPGDAIHYDAVSTMKGVLADYIPGDRDFDVPTAFLDAARKKDFGVYRDPLKGDIVVDFITNADGTDGDEGAPVLDGKGALLGLAIDFPRESADRKFLYDPSETRTVCVDIRYVLWCLDKLQGAQELVREMTIAP